MTSERIEPNKKKLVSESQNVQDLGQTRSFVQIFTTQTKTLSDSETQWFLSPKSTETNFEGLTERMIEQESIQEILREIEKSEVAMSKDYQEIRSTSANIDRLLQSLN